LHRFGDAVIKVEKLTKVYGRVRAVDDVSFQVDRGEVFAFLGPNGAGKTTTIEMIQAIRTPTSGRVEVLGKYLYENGAAEEIKSRIGVLPQTFSSLDRLNVRESIELFAGMYPKPRSTEELMRLLELTPQAGAKFEALSGGQKQRVGIAAALVNDPELVFLDEPTTGLDPKSRRDVWKVINDMKAAGKTVFLTTHYMEEAELLADRIAIMFKGRIVEMDTPHALLERYGGRKTVRVDEVSFQLAASLREAFPGARFQEEFVEIEVGSASEIAAVMQVLSKSGHEDDVTVKNPSIEDVFLKVVGAKISEEGEAA
jgi:ABC-2 type transport system ATP-binding protein